MLDRVQILCAYLRARFARPARRAIDTRQPIITPSEYATRFEHFNRLALPLDKARELAFEESRGARPRYRGYSFGLSTGTMGEPGVFITTQAERLRWTGTVLARYLRPGDLLSRRIALILKHDNALYHSVRIRYFDAARPVDTWAFRLCEWEPEVLAGPVSVLEELACSAAFGRRPFRPAVVIAGAEPMLPQDKRMLAEAFQVMPRPIYQAKEGFLAYGCTEGRMHWNEDLLSFEFLPFGERLLPVISDFTRTTQSYRRYRMDDVILPGARECRCGSAMQAFDAVEGRIDDVLLHPSLDLLFPSELNSVLGEPLHFTVTQPRLDEIYLAGDGDLEALRTFVAPARVHRAEFKAPRPGEKRRRFQRLFDLPFPVSSFDPLP